MCDFSEYGGPSSEWLAVEATLPLPLSVDLAERKRITNAGREEIAAKVFKEISSQVHVRDFSVLTRNGDAIEGRTYRPSRIPQDQRLPVYVHFHGGGFLFGTLASEDAICAQLSIRTNLMVLNINYRHTPEHTYPTPWNDAQDAVKWLYDNMDDLAGDKDCVVVGGISAGAQLAASLVLEKHLGKALQEYPAIRGQVLMIPCVVNTDCRGPDLLRLTSPEVSSYVENEFAPILPVRTARLFTDLLKVENPQEDDTKLNPGNAKLEQLKGVPPTVFGIAGLDPLRDEGLLYAKSLTEAG
jgi:acetyl esterase/lipase